MSASDETRPMPPVPTSGGEPPHRWDDRRRLGMIGGAVGAAVALLVGVFFIGQSSGSSTQSGPTSLAAALTAARTGSLPCGTTNAVARRTLDRLCSGTLTAGGANGGQGGTTNPAAGRGLMVGTITSVSGNQVTVQTGQGPVTLTVGSDATVHTITSGSATDLTTGARVVITNGAATGTGNGARQIVVLGTRAGAGVATTTSPPSS